MTWKIPEIQEIMDEAGFKKSEVYLHDFNDHGESDEKYCLRKTLSKRRGMDCIYCGNKQLKMNKKERSILIKKSLDALYPSVPIT